MNLKSLPGQIECECVGKECPTSDNPEEAVSYNLTTDREVRFGGGGGTEVHSISIWEAEGVSGHQGIMKTGGFSVKHSRELSVKDTKLHMKTSQGEKEIKETPGDALSVAKRRGGGEVKGIELREESQSPVYSVKSKRKTKILSIIPVSMEVETNVNAETGEVQSMNKPWWSALSLVKMNIDPSFLIRA